MFMANRPRSFACWTCASWTSSGMRPSALGVDLPRDQLLVDEPSGALLDLAILLGQARRGHGR
jgi:hypothetical protein